MTIRLLLVCLVAVGGLILSSNTSAQPPKVDPPKKAIPEPPKVEPKKAPEPKKVNVENVTADGSVKTKLSAADQLKHFKLPEGYTIELVAAEPTIINPITITLDDKGRMLVSESHTYRYGPGGSPVKPFKNPVVRLEPKPEGGFERVVVADGFDDPVMGIAVKGDKLWLSACQYLYQYDYPPTGPATNKKAIVSDKTKAWNPFGMFVLEWGPDGLLYMSVGDHKVLLEGPTNKLDSRGTSGVILRMNPDGSNMERLTQGFRVPYSFEFDPFGQLWLLSNGEGNPNRFARIIPGVDYHCYTRKIDNPWLAGNHPLAPPVFELHRGADTQLMRYYGAAYPDLQGDLLLCNWGAHGFSGPNRGIFRYRPDARGEIVEREAFVWCNDPHFRPSHIALDPDGNLLITDWYGRDDESDNTGRIWRVKFNGKATTPTAANPMAALGSPSHLERERAMNQLVKESSKQLGDLAAKSPTALGGANALWCLVRQGTNEAKQELLAGVKHSDPRVRRLALDLARRFEGDGKNEFAQKLRATALPLVKDSDPAVRLEAAMALDQPQAIVDVLSGDVAKDRHLRYQAAAALAKTGGPKEIAAVLKSDDPNVRLAGLIAVDVACYEKHPSKKDALAGLADALAGNSAADLNLVLFLVQQHSDKEMLPVLEKLVTRGDLPPAIVSRAMVTYRTLSGGKLPPLTGESFLKGVEKGAIPLTTTPDHMNLLELVEAAGPTPTALAVLAKEMQSGIPPVKQAANALARKFGPKASTLADPLWATVNKEPAVTIDALDALATLATIESTPRAEAWSQALAHPDPLVRTDAVRWRRTLKTPAMAKAFAADAPIALKLDPELEGDLAAVLRELGVNSPGIAADDGKRDKDDLTKLTIKKMNEWAPIDKQKHALLGKQVFERSNCAKCHTTVIQNTPLAPSLKGVGAQKIEYLIESILEPSKIIKTGWESQTIVTKAGKSLNGLVKDEGTHFRVQNLDVDVRVPKADVEERTTQKVSIMPAGQESQLSRREFVDLIAYLWTLK